MFAAVRRYRFDPKDNDEIAHRIRDVFVYLLQKTPGFDSYYWLDTGEGEGASVSVFRDKEGAEQSTQIAARFVEDHLASLMGKPEVTQAEVKVRAWK